MGVSSTKKWTPIMKKIKRHHNRTMMKIIMLLNPTGKPLDKKTPKGV